jgi:cyclopropane fatty-acyl-phospholipid synthase-like methyltransferase
MSGGSSRDVVSDEVFRDLYRRNPDPWNFAHSAYEQNRYRQILDALLLPRYDRAFEPGCSVGELTRRLAPRCRSLVSTDIVDSAVALARFRCRNHRHVSITRASLAGELPAGPFDLIILSEVGYYFSRRKLSEIARSIASTLAPDAELVAAHWLGSSADHLLHADEVHEVLGEHLPLRWVKGNRTTGFRLDTWRGA